MLKSMRHPKIDPVESLRPTTLEDYIGQEQIKDLLWTAIYAAKKRNQPLDHVLLNGPPGLGKTTLANVIAYEMGWELKTIIAPALGTPRVAFELLITLPPNTMLFIDEIHRVRKPVQEVLYPVLEDGLLFSSIASNPTGTTLNPLTIIGATTNIGKLEQPFIDRFGLPFQLEYYTIDELDSIVMASGEKLGMGVVSWEVADAISSRSRGTPRIANTMLRRIRDYHDLDPKSPITANFVNKIIGTKLHTDELGLRPVDHRYLQYLENQDSPVGVSTISTAISEEEDTVQDFVEPYLLRLGFIERRSNGRWLTEDGKTFAQKIK